MSFAKKIMAGKDPLTVYAAACQMRMPNLALEAAKLSLLHEQIILTATTPAGLDCGQPSCHDPLCAHAVSRKVQGRHMHPALRTGRSGLEGPRKDWREFRYFSARSATRDPLMTTDFLAKARSYSTSNTSASCSATCYVACLDLCRTHQRSHALVDAAHGWFTREHKVRVVPHVYRQRCARTPHGDLVRGSTLCVNDQARACFVEAATLVCSAYYCPALH
ncbi:uncharacterized protein C8Q71DRAFT_462024 [Rhodofomes roseus]|uniref:Uncharacterized protein n=1 Tax=Rhodofomes roseus TaxID=34475 RepID=A0ABQ8KPJ2_9APHY|nr:uncharacterized protein C8Q71DRAFT_462024 [Rhodofomes roseus]KAH9839767.1 hypothetical protein C8Q71DRAFT_462024 [Rhodofomes roseus]